MITNEDFEVGLGLPGSGKSTSQGEEEILPALLDGEDVYANTFINLDLPNNHYYFEFDDIQNVRNCIVWIDEICHVLDPREWASENKAVRDFFQLHRHRHVGILANTQHISLIPKTALIEVSRFFMCDRLWNSNVIKTLFPNFPWIVIQETEMSWTEIKQEENGFIVRNRFEDDDEEYEFDAGEIRTNWFNKEKMLHRELNNIKKELIHWYCPKCKQRQGVNISKLETDEFAHFDKKKNCWIKHEHVVAPLCPKHKEVELEIRESAIFDSYYEFDRPEKDIIWIPYHKEVKTVQYKGRLSEEQLERKKELEKRSII